MSERLEAMKVLTPDAFCVTCLASAIMVLADEGNDFRMNFYSTEKRIMYEHPS